MAFNPKAVKGYNKHYRQIQGPRTVRRVRARVPARTYGHTHARTFNPKAHRQHTPPRVKRAVRAKVARGKAQQRKARQVRFARKFNTLLTPRNVSMLDVLGAHPHRYRPLTRPEPKLPKSKPSFLSQAVSRGLHSALEQSPIGGALQVGQATSHAPKSVRKQLGYQGALPTQAHRLAKSLEGPKGQKQSSFAPGKLLGEGIDIAAQTPASTALSLQALDELAKGKPSKVRKIQRDYAKTSAAVALAERRPGEAFKRFKQHPVATALEFSGARAVAGRAAGAAGRAAGVKAASTERPPLSLGPKELKPPKQNRAYSRDVIQKGARKGVEKVQRKFGVDPNVALRRQSVRPGNQGQIIRPKVLRRVDEQIAAGEGVRKVRVAKAIHDTLMQGGKKKKVRKIQPLPEHHQAAVYLAADRTIRKPEMFRADLEKHLARLNAEFRQHGSGWSNEERRQNRDNVAQGAKILADLGNKKIDPQKIHQAADEFQPAEAERQARLHEFGARSKEELNAALVPFAVEHMGARPNLKTGKLEVPGQTFDRPASIKSIQRRVQKAKRQSQGGTHAGLEEAQARVRTTPTHTATPRELPPAEIRAEMRRQGVKEPAMISHVQRGNPFYIPMVRNGMRPPRPSTKHRTGLAQVRGTREASGRAMVRQAAGSENLATAHENIYRTVNEWGLNPAGKTKEGYDRYIGSYDKAVRVATEITHDPAGKLKPGHVPMVPFNIAKFRESRAKLNAIEANTQDVSRLEEAQTQALSDSVREALAHGQGRGQYILIPQDVANRLETHHFRPSDLEKVLQRLSTHWKNVTLTTASPVSWLASNVGDLGIRSAFAGLGPGSRMTGGRLLKAGKRLDAEGKVPKGSAQRVHAEVTPGALFASSEKLATHRPMLREGGIGSLPVIRHAAGAWRTWYQGVYRFEGALERQPQIAALGKAARQDIRHTTGAVKDYMRLSGKAIDDYATRMATSPDLRSELANKVDEVVGRWGKTSPDMRRVLMSTGPFVQWLRVALKYVYVTLPKDHPIKTGIAAALYQATDEERKKLGFSLSGSKQLADYQQGSIPFPGIPGKVLRFAKFTSFGTASQPSQVPGFLYPQFSSAAKAMQGQAWTGDQLKYPPGTPNAGQELSQGDKDKLAAYLLVEGFTPFASMAKRVLEKGGSDYPTSTLFPLGGIGGPTVYRKSDQKGLIQGAIRANNPFRPLKPVYVKKKKGSSSGGGGGSSGGGPKPYVIR